MRPSALAYVIAAVVLAVTAVPVAYAARPAVRQVAHRTPQTSARSATVPTPDGYRRATPAERRAMARTARRYPGANGRLGRATGAFVGIKDPSYGFVCLVEHLSGDTDVLGIGVRPAGGHRWKLWEMTSGAMQNYAQFCIA
jgi:hypothetical protein